MSKILLLFGGVGILCALFILRYLAQGLEIEGVVDDLRLITDCELNTGPTKKNYVAVITGDATLIYFSFKDPGFDLEKSTAGWEVISLFEPPSAKPYNDFSADQIAHFHHPISEADTTVVGVWARKDGILLQAYSSKANGVFWGLLRGADFKRSESKTLDRAP